MQALVKSRSEPGLWLGEVDVPKIGINDVLIKVLRTGICGTDVHIYKWNEWAQATIPVPMTIGHEFVGRIVETGTYWQPAVSFPRSSNRTCGFPASGFPTDFTASSRKGPKVHIPQP